MKYQQLWCDLLSDEERIEFLESGKAVETGIIAPSVVEDVIRAFKAAATWNFITEDLIAFAEAVIETERWKYQELIEKAEAVIARWETPSWKEAEPTAEAIYKLRDAVERVKEVEE